MRYFKSNATGFCFGFWFVWVLVSWRFGIFSLDIGSTRFIKTKSGFSIVKVVHWNT